MHFRREDLTQDRLNVLIYEKNILWEITTLRYKEYEKKEYKLRNIHYACIQE